jgi:YbbR domain-containing protein
MTQTSSQKRKAKRVPSVFTFLRKIFIDDWAMKFVALLITITLWFGVSGLRTNTTARLKSVALNIKLQNDMELTSASLAEIDLFVTGDKRKVDPLNPRDLVASLDLTQMMPGERVVQLTPSNVIVDLPTGVSLDSVEPTQIPIKLERIITKDLPIQPNFIGNPSGGLEFYSAESTPKTVRVRGPEGVLEGLKSLSSERIDLRDRTESFTINQLNLANDNQRVRLLAASVSLSVVIGPKRIQRNFEVPVTINGKSRILVVTVLGPGEELQKLKPENFRVTNIDDQMPEVAVPENLRASVEIRKVQIR